jgi:hypothetical protein
MKLFVSKQCLTSLAAVLILLGGAPLLHAGTQDFTLVNDTGLTIYQLYLSPTKSGEWGGDVLGVDVLESGDQTDITFSSQATSKVWDLQIVDEEGESHWWRSLRLNEITKVTLYFENGIATADFEWVE